MTAFRKQFYADYWSNEPGACQRCGLVLPCGADIVTETTELRADEAVSVGEVLQFLCVECGATLAKLAHQELVQRPWAPTQREKQAEHARKIREQGAR
jgi:hypothetical protein